MVGVIMIGDYQLSKYSYQLNHKLKQTNNQKKERNS